jgi:hypothetical protein
MRQFVRRNTSRVIALPRLPGTTTRTRVPKPQFPRSSLLGAGRVNTLQRTQSSPRPLLEDAERKRLIEPIGNRGHGSVIDVGPSPSERLQQPRPSRKRTLSELGSDSNNGSDSDLGHLSKAK